MKAAVLEKLNSPLTIVEGIEVPDLKRGQVWVELAYSGVCHSQLMECDGQRGRDAYLPHLLGHEGSGIVRNVGKDVTKVKVGDRVVLGWIKDKGIDAGSTLYKKKGTTYNSGAVTTFSTFTVASENRVYHIKDSIPLDVAVLFGCAILTGAGIVINALKPRPKTTIAIFGVGGIGLSALMATQLFSFSQVIVVDISHDKLELAKQLGATVVINAQKENPVTRIHALTGGQGTDYSIDAAGSVRTIEQAFESIRRGGGLCVFASHPPIGQKIAIDPYELICGKQIKGSWGGDSKPWDDIPKFSKFYLEGKLPLKKLFTKRYRLEQINEAMIDLKCGKVARPLLVINPELER